MAKCPNCGAFYDREEYRKDVAKIFCTACKSVLPWDETIPDDSHTEFHMQGAILHVCGKHTNSCAFTLKYAHAKNCEVYRRNHLLLKIAKDVEFEGKSIGLAPRFSYFFWPGVFGTFKSDKGVFALRRVRKHVLRISLDGVEMGTVEYRDSDPVLTFKDGGRIDFPYQLTMACSLYGLLYDSSSG